MENKSVQQTWLGMTWLLLGLVINHVGAQENPAGVQQGGVKLVETRTDDHSGTNEPPRDKRYFAFADFNGPQPFQQTVPFEALNNFNQQQNRFGDLHSSRNFAPDVINTYTNNQYFNQFRNSNGRFGNRPMNNMRPGWGFGDWSRQWGWPSNDWFWGQSYGSWGQNTQWRPWGGQPRNNGQWNQFDGRPVSGPWNQVDGRSGRRWPSYNQYGYGYPYGIRH